MAISTTSDISIMRTVSVLQDGKQRRAALIQGRVSPNTSVTIILSVSDKELAQANATAIAAEYDRVQAEILALARDQGLPV